MTVIVAARESETKVWMAADRLSSTTSMIFESNESKLVKTKHVLFGSSGCCRPIQIVTPVLRAYQPTASLIQWLRGEAADKASTALEAAGWLYAPEHKDYIDEYDFEFLITDGEQICSFGYTLEAHLENRFYACGSGEDIAMGALYGCDYMEAPARDSAICGVKAACKYSPTVGGKVDCLSIG